MSTSSFPRDPKHTTLFQHVPLRDGYKVVGPCRLERLIGHGGMGVVYRGFHLRLRIPVAVKCVLVDRLDENTALDRRLWHEARIAASVNHPNMVRVFDCGISHGVPYMIMELVEGETLSELVRREGPLEPAEAVRLMIDTARGVGVAHALQKVHRDLKPSNIMLDRSGAVKVTDFGVAKDLGGEGTNLTRSGQGLGTPNYMPIEQWTQARAVTPAADVYALGATLYYCLTGKPGVDGPSLPELLSLITTKGHPDIREACPGIPADLARVINRAVRKNAKRRYPNADHFADALEGVQSAGTLGRVARSLLSRPRAAAATSAPLAVVDGAATRPSAVAPAGAGDDDVASAVYLPRPSGVARAIEWVGLIAALAVLGAAAGFILGWPSLGLGSDETDRRGAVLASGTEAAPTPSTAAGPGERTTERERSVEAESPPGPLGADPEFDGPAAEAVTPARQVGATGTNGGAVGGLPPPVEDLGSPGGSADDVPDGGGDATPSDDADATGAVPDDEAPRAPAVTPATRVDTEPAAAPTTGPDQRIAGDVPTIAVDGLEPVEGRADAWRLAADPTVVLVWSSDHPDVLLGATEITNAQYRRFLEDVRWDPPEDPGFIGIDDYVRAAPNHPAVSVPHADAVAYCDWAGVPGLRLPAAAEWRAAVTGGGGRFPWGNDHPDPRRVGIDRGARTGPAEVATSPDDATVAGVYDLVGNVCEWLDRGEGDGEPRFIGSAFGAAAEDTDPGRAPLSLRDPYGSSSAVGFRIALPIAR